MTSVCWLNKLNTTSKKEKIWLTILPLQKKFQHTSPSFYQTTPAQSEYSCLVCIFNDIINITAHRFNLVETLHMSTWLFQEPTSVLLPPAMKMSVRETLNASIMAMLYIGWIMRSVWLDVDVVGGQNYAGSITMHHILHATGRPIECAPVSKNVAPKSFAFSKRIESFTLD